MKKLTFIAALAISGTQLLAQSTVTNGLVAAYKFNNSIVDSSGNGHDATATGGTLFVADRFGCPNRAFVFSNGARILNVDPSTQFDIGYGDYSASFWAKYVPNASDIIPFLINDSNSGYEWFQFQNYGLGNAMAFAVKSGNDASQTPAIKQGGIKDGQWHHYVGVRRNVTHLDLYFDGALVATADNNAITSIDSYSPGMRPIEIGSAVGSNRYNDGSLDDLYFYNRALTPADIQKLFTESQACAAVVATDKVTAAAGSFRLAPNPTANGVCRIIAAQDYRDLTVSLTDLTGKVLRAQQVASIGAQQSIDLPLQGIAAGSYYVSLRTAEGVQTQQLVVMEN